MGKWFSDIGNSIYRYWKFEFLISMNQLICWYRKINMNYTDICNSNVRYWQMSLIFQYHNSTFVYCNKGVFKVLHKQLRHTTGTGVWCTHKWSLALNINNIWPLPISCQIIFVIFDNKNSTSLCHQAQHCSCTLAGTSYSVNAHVCDVIIIWEHTSPYILVIS